MATPRVFVSSTCYDLKEVRLQLRNFIEEFGFDPVMSEFGDIFYDYTVHVQDACLSEINKCQLFTLIIGNNYGSFYHKNDRNDFHIPDSVTLKEFKEALSNNIYKHIFINKYVDYDYKNYTRALENENYQYFKSNNVPDEEIDETKNKIKKEFNEKYYFPQESYKYIFYFLEIIYELGSNNAVIIFESFDDIRNSLRKQWAGFMYDAITKRNNISLQTINPLIDKIDNIENQIKRLIDTKSIKSETEIFFDISKLSKVNDIENLEKIKEKIYLVIQNIFQEVIETDEYNYKEQRIEFYEIINEHKINNWLEYVKLLLNDYKWSKYIRTDILFKDFLSKINFNLIPYKVIFELYSIYTSLPVDEQKVFQYTLVSEFNNYVTKNKSKIKTNSADDFDLEDDIPPF